MSFVLVYNLRLGVVVFVMGVVIDIGFNGKLWIIVGV